MSMDLLENTKNAQRSNIRYQKQPQLTLNFSDISAAAMASLKLTSALCEMSPGKPPDGPCLSCQNLTDSLIHHIAPSSYSRNLY